MGEYTFPFASGTFSLDSKPEPGVVMRGFLKAVKKAARDKALPVLNGTKGNPEAVLGLYGFAAIGRWGSTGVYGGHDQGKLVIHWPTVFSGMFEYLAPSPFLGLAGLVMEFDTLIKMYSPHALELLRRKIHKLSYETQRIMYPAGYVELTATEGAILRTWMAVRMSTPDKYPFLEIFKASFAETFKAYIPKSHDYVLSQALRRNGVHHDFPGGNSAFTILNTRTPERGYPEIKQVELRGANHPDFGPANVNAFTEELLVARDIGLAVPAPPEHTGVLRIRPTEEFPEYPKVLAINLLRYYAYRRNLTNNYEKILPAHIINNTLEAARFLQNKYDTSSAGFLGPLHRAYQHSHVCKKLCVDEKKICLDDEEWKMTILLSLDHFQEMMASYRRIELGKPQTTKPQVPRLKTHNFYDDTFVDPLTGVPYRFYFFRRGTTILVAPTWQVNTDDVLVKTARPYNGDYAYKTRDGVRVMNGHYPKYFFTFEALFRDPQGQANQLHGLDLWIEERLSATSSMFLENSRASKLKKNARSRLSTTGHDLRGIPFSKEEDEAILKYYHKGITPQQKTELFAACDGRSLSAIRAHARALTKTMIENGEYDIKKLPVMRRDGEVLDLIRKAKARSKLKEQA